MKSLQIIIVFLIFIHITYGQTKIVKPEDKYEYVKPVRGTIKTNPMAYLVGPIIFTAEFRLAVETKMAEKQSFQLGASYLGKSFYLSAFEKNDTSFLYRNNIRFIINGYRLQLTYKWYLDRHDAPKGFFIGPHFSYSYVKFTTNHNNRYAEYLEAKYINYNLISGYQFVINDFFVIETYGGLGYKDNIWTETYGGQTTKYTDDDFVVIRGDLKIILGFNLGIAF